MRIFILSLWSSLSFAGSASETMIEGQAEPEAITWQDTQQDDQGLVLVIGLPGSEVYVDDQHMGSIPGNVKIGEGIHFFKMVTPDGQSCTVGRDIRFFREGAPPVVHIQC